MRLLRAALEEVHDDSMKDRWSKLVKKAHDHEDSEQHDPKLRGGAHDGDFEKIEKTYEIELPETFKAAYRVHDGQAEDGVLESLLPRHCRFMPVAWINQEKKIYLNLLHDEDWKDSTPEIHGTAEVKSEFYNPKWVIFGSSPDTSISQGSHFALDFDPGPHGHVGQVIEMEMEDGTRKRVAASFESWFKHLTK